MGTAKQILEEHQEKELHKALAKKLGISYDDFIKLDYLIETNTSDDGLIYSYLLRFNKNSNFTILKRIKGLDNFTFELEPSFFDTV